MKRLRRVFLNLFPGLIPLAVLLCVVPFTAHALRGELEIGGDRGQRTGIDTLSAILNQLPAGTAIHNYALDWHLGYYLGVDSAVHPVFQPSPQALKRAVCADKKPGYFVTPAYEAERWIMPLQVNGIGTTLLWQSTALRLYRLDCDF